VLRHSRLKSFLEMSTLKHSASSVDISCQHCIYVY